MDKSSKKKLVNDIENRLDNFFSDDSDESQPDQSEQPDQSDPPEQPKFSPLLPNQPLEKLKSAVLSIDWEITDECLSELIVESEVLLPQFEKDAVTHALLRMLRALGKYIRKRKAQAHQDAIRRVMSVFNSLESLITDETLDEKQKKRIVAQEIVAFKLLKEQVEANRKVRYPTDNTGTGHPSPPPSAENSSNLLTQDSIKQAVSAVEERFNEEVADLRARILSLQEEINTLRKD